MVRIVLVGAGRVACSFLPALLSAGHQVVQVYSRTMDSARTLAEPFGIPYTNDLSVLTCQADIYIVAVSDDALPRIAPYLVRGREEVLFLHTAGSVPIDVWRLAGARRYGIFYPLQTFSKNRLVTTEDLPFFIEASDMMVRYEIESFAATLSSRIYYADSTLRSRLHIAAVFACNFTNAMYTAASDLLATGNIPFEVLLPLIDETSRKVHDMPPRQAQTGPAARNDTDVMHRHIDQLASNSDLQVLYRLLSDYIIHRNN